jgi:two-component system, sensor histidine kinase
MRSALHSGDADRLGKTAHGAKGAALNLGLKALAASAHDIHRAAAVATPQMLAEQVQRFELLMAASADELRRRGVIGTASA